MSLEHTIRSMFIKEDVEPIVEDGHQDVASAKRQCKTIIEDAQAIMSALNSMDNEGSLPTWWTNKLAVASNSMNKMNDYISNPTEMKEEVEIEEMKVRGKEVYDKTFANKTQADNYAKKHGGRVQQVGRVFYVFKEELEEAVKYPHMMYDPKTGKEVEAKSPEDHEKYAKMGYTHDKPKDMEEARNPNKSGGSGYDLYHKDFSSAMKHAYDYAKSKLGVEVDPKEIDDKVASGPRKPSKGKTNTYRLKGKDGKKAVQIQVANLDDKKFELNMYKESVELDEAYKTPAEASAYEAGKKAARSGKKYDDNPNKKGSKEYTAWSKGHNEARAKGMKEEVELTESPMVTFTVPNVTSDMASKLERIAKEKKIEYSRKGRTVVLKGKRIDMTMLRTKMGLAQTNIPMVPVKEEVELGEAKGETSAVGIEVVPDPTHGADDRTSMITGILNKVNGANRQAKDKKVLTYRRKINGKDHTVFDGLSSSIEQVKKELKKGGVKMVAIGSKTKPSPTPSNSVVMEKKDEPPFDVSKADYKGAAKELTDYAMKKGGMDKNDFLGFANRMSAIASKKSPRVTARFARDLEALDTSPREKIISVMRNNGIKVTMAGRGLKIEGVGAELTSTQRLRAILETEVPVTKSEQPLTVGQSIMEKAIARIREAEGEKMTDAQLKRREEIAKDLPDDEFKDRYGDKWMQVKMATATKMAKGEK